jgi:hypothetical protein
MATLSPSMDSCSAHDVVRGLGRLLHRQSQTMICEVPLPNGRRADAVAIDAKGVITIVEIKVARADLLGDSKWPDYLDWCDRFYWALAPTLDASVLDDASRLPERCGLIIADRYDGHLVREAATFPLAAARRRVALLRLGRLSMHRLMIGADPDLAQHATERDIGL